MTEAAIFELLLYMCWSHPTPDQQWFQVFVYADGEPIVIMTLDDGTGFVSELPGGEYKWCTDLSMPVSDQRVTWDVAAVNDYGPTMSSNGPSYQVCGVRPCLGRVVSSPATEGM